ncbi:hypothetical protein CRYUN_Cryun04dG0151600 [Craigia yunnanensis]
MPSFGGWVLPFWVPRRNKEKFWVTPSVASSQDDAGETANSEKVSRWKRRDGYSQSLCLFGEGLPRNMVAADQLVQDEVAGEKSEYERRVDRERVGEYILGLEKPVSDVAFSSYFCSEVVILGADTRATLGLIVCDKNCEKIHYMAPNIYCCGAGTSADTEAVTDMVSSQLQLHQYHTGRESRVTTALTLLKSHLFNYQGYVQAVLVLGGVDVTGPHLHTVSILMDLRTLPFATMGSGSLAAMAVFESKYHEGLTKEEGINLVCEAICAGIFNDLGSGSNVDVCVITRGHKEYLRNYQVPNPRADISSKGFTFPKKTEVLLTTITLLREKAEVIEDGDAMEE